MMRKTELKTFNYILTAEPLCREHLSAPVGCPVLRGVPKSEVDLNTALCIYMRSPLLYCFLDFIHTFHHMSTPVTTPYLYSLSVLYSHSLMKVSV